MKECDKKAQMKMSFGMIFSIILIVIFLSFAIYVILKFLDMQTSVQTNKFVDDLQDDIDKIWKGSQGSNQYEYALPSKIKYVCFVDLTKRSSGDNRDWYVEFRDDYVTGQNMFFYPFDVVSPRAVELENVYLGLTLTNANPYCIVNDGKIKITLEKEFGESLVTIK